MENHSLTQELKSDYEKDIKSEAEEHTSIAVSYGPAWALGVSRVNRKISLSSASASAPQGQAIIISKPTPIPNAPILNKSYDGSYSYRGTLPFTIDRNAITILRGGSDGDPSNLPSQGPLQDRKGNPTRYRRIRQHEGPHQKYLQNLGKVLARNVCGKAGNAQPIWHLTELPYGYSLWEEVKGGRKDPYLYGSETVTRFRSMPEFAPHAIWLLLGRQGTCACMYCTPGQAQRPITDGLRGIKRVAKHQSTQSASVFAGVWTPIERPMKEDRTSRPDRSSRDTVEGRKGATRGDVGEGSSKESQRSAKRKRESSREQRREREQERKDRIYERPKISWWGN
ncbi:hypothetical protein FA95DRAFT_1560628 [Auriscalpium vulgare]|uniref:Uncharacterized protein n=1 Tax=Auriscalpium vulgare TaxID=40419 RepID=A0ACB8RQD8_9AGAM|nr:hypothetical protein FA95DRAFT_1560628 [Auriscalpium vulgare]